MLCLVLLVLWKQAQVECHGRDAAQGAASSTCSHEEEEHQDAELE
ncbi:hypothetical protein [Luteolibacter luteus]|nr:hypothetical protein [Luteolibacter luteus]